MNRFLIVYFTWKNLFIYSTLSLIFLFSYSFIRFCFCINDTFTIWLMFLFDIGRQRWGVLFGVNSQYRVFYIFSFLQAGDANDEIEILFSSWTIDFLWQHNKIWIKTNFIHNILIYFVFFFFWFHEVSKQSYMGYQHKTKLWLLYMSPWIDSKKSMDKLKFKYYWTTKTATTLRFVGFGFPVNSFVFFHFFCIWW